MLRTQSLDHLMPEFSAVILDHEMSVPCLQFRDPAVGHANRRRLMVAITRGNGQKRFFGGILGGTLQVEMPNSIEKQSQKIKIRVT
jgi:hypothetical protein